MADDTATKELILVLTKYGIILTVLIGWILLGISMGIPKKVVDSVEGELSYTENELSNFDPTVLFCGPGDLSQNMTASVQGVSLGELNENINVNTINTDEPVLPDATVTSCSDEKILNRCSDYTGPELFSYISRQWHPPSSPDESSIDEFCGEGNFFNSNENWCDNSNNYTDISSDLSNSNYRNKIMRHCCQEKTSQSSFSTFKFVTYLIITVPLFSAIAYKVLKHTYIKSQTPRDVLTQKTKEGFTYVASRLGKKSKFLFLFIFIYFVILPIGRWFMVSMSCPVNVVNAQQCGRPCDSNEDCSSLHGNCGYCVGGECSNPSFHGAFGSSFELADISIDVCSETVDSAKLLPGQVIQVNDTANPFTMTIPPIYESGVKPEFNNFVELEDTPTQSSNITCTDGHKTMNGLRGMLEQQDLNSQEDAHNKLFINGTVEGSNSFPCSEIVIPSTSKNLIEGALQDPNLGSEINSLGDSSFHSEWTQEFELKRITCAEQNGLCYMKDYPCSINDVPIPLKYLDGGLPQLTIGSLNQTGCQQAAYPCTPDTSNTCSDYGEECAAREECLYVDGQCVNACTTLEHDGTYLKEGKGLCKSVTWNTTNTYGGSPTWVEDSSGTDYRCIPADKWMSGGSSDPGYASSPLLNDAVYTYDSTNGFTSQCTHIPRVPQVPDAGSVEPTIYVAWSSSIPEGSDYKLCSEGSSSLTGGPGEQWAGSCPSSYELIPGVITYLDSGNTRLEDVYATCCYQPYATDDLVGTAEVQTP